MTDALRSRGGDVEFNLDHTKVEADEDHNEVEENEEKATPRPSRCHTKASTQQSAKRRRCHGLTGFASVTDAGGLAEAKVAPRELK